MWLQNVKHHAFPIKTPEDNNFQPSAKTKLEKDFEYKQLNHNYAVDKDKDIFASLDCDISKLLPLSD